jgi:transcriptional regulator with XRE-family HTH domain
MITMDILGKVRRMKMREKLTISEIAKRTGLARNTVKRWLNAPGRKLPQIENNMKIEASISLRRRDEEVKVHGEPDCCNLG